MPHEEQKTRHRRFLLRRRKHYIAFIFYLGVNRCLWVLCFFLQCLSLFFWFLLPLLLFHSIFQCSNLLRKFQDDFILLQLFWLLLHLHSFNRQTLRRLYFIYLDHGVKTVSVSTNKDKLQRLFRAPTCGMVPDCCTLDILSAGIRCEGGEEGGDGLYFWEMAVYFAIFEEIIQNYQQFSQENSFLVAVTLPRSLLCQRLHQFLKMQLMIAQNAIQRIRRYLYSRVGVRLSDTLFLKYSRLHNSASQLQGHSRKLPAGDAPLNDHKNTTIIRMPQSLSSRKIFLQQKLKQLNLAIDTNNSSHLTMSNWSAPANCAVSIASFANETNSQSLQ